MPANEVSGRDDFRAVGLTHRNSVGYSAAMTFSFQTAYFALGVLSLTLGLLLRPARR